MSLAKIRIYKEPKGYIDIICNSVSIIPTNGSHKAQINGGEQDGRVIHNVYGAEVLKEISE